MNLSEQVMGDEAAWNQACDQIAQGQIYAEEREALRRLAVGLGCMADVALLAGSLGHKDMFRTERANDE